MAKKSLAEMQAEVSDSAHNGNMSNIAHALRHLEMAKLEAKKEIEKFDTEVARLKKELEELAEKDQLELNYSDIRKPYDKAQTIALVMHTDKYTSR